MMIMKVKDLKFVVLTGGPGAGKTAVLELARRVLPAEQVYILPEAASIVFGGGFPRRGGLGARKASQRAIFHIQRELEARAREEAKSGLVLCDRGSLDGLAYWPESEETFWNELRTNKAAELKRYDLVIHLRTPPPEHGYNHDNPIRRETPEEAGDIDARIADAWKQHPRYMTIESSPDFLVKAEKALEIIRQRYRLSR
jgi:predicted ATPase